MLRGTGLTSAHWLGACIHKTVSMPLQDGNTRMTALSRRHYLRAMVRGIARNYGDA